MHAAEYLILRGQVNDFLAFLQKIVDTNLITKFPMMLPVSSDRFRAFGER